MPARRSPRSKPPTAPPIPRPAPRSPAKVTDVQDERLAFSDDPAEPRAQLRATRPIESTVATVRHRTKLTKGPASRAAGRAMACNLSESAPAGRRDVDAPHLVALVRAGAHSEGGRQFAREDLAA